MGEGLVSDTTSMVTDSLILLLYLLSENVQSPHR